MALFSRNCVGYTELKKEVWVTDIYTIHKVS